MTSVILCLVVVTVSFLLLPARCVSAPNRINIGAASASSSMLSLWAAQEQGFFAKHGIDAQLILIRGGSTLVASLLAGEIQMLSRPGCRFWARRRKASTSKC
jgi:ABC-type nitrate/sulfonate/bicarbonate transport system substrate-binding protein